MALVLTVALMVTVVNESAAASSTYTVKKGDTLYNISRAHKVSVSNLKSWNNIKSNIIHPNQNLKLVAGSTTAKSKVVKTASKATNNNVSKGFTASTIYTVKKGDTLSKISRAYKVSVSNLKSWNNIKSNIIHPNQKIKVVGSTTAKNLTTNTPSRSTNDNVKKEFTVSASAYTANCNGCSGITKTGINLKRNPNIKVIAVDPNVIKLGTKVYVEGYGYAIAGDIGGAIKGNKIDVFIPNKSDAYKWGRKNVKITILD